jgi:hypothetical protein
VLVVDGIPIDGLLVTVAPTKLLPFILHCWFDTYPFTVVMELIAGCGAVVIWNVAVNVSEFVTVNVIAVPAGTLVGVKVMDVLVLVVYGLDGIPIDGLLVTVAPLKFVPVIVQSVFDI